MYKKVSIKKTKQAKDKRHSTEDLGTLQKTYKGKTQQYLLHLQPNGTYWFKLAYRSPLGKGQSWRVSQVRLKGIKTAVLQLQYKQGRYGSGFLLKNVEGNRRRKDGAIADG